MIITERMDGAIDPQLMANAHIVVVGIGGASGICEDFARSNVGKITAIDFDVVDHSNLTTQGFYQQDVGTPKTTALGKKLRQINPKLEYRGLNRDFLKLSESDVEKICAEADLLMFMTDNFYAQARGNRLALKLQKPAIFAMVYEKAACAEITFTIPGVTPGCHRCAVSSRYQAYDEGFDNNVKQARSTVFSTRYLNACLGMLALAIVHNNTTGYEFSNWFGDHWERNLIQLRMNPAYGDWDNSLFNRVFNQSPYVFNFDSVWQKVEAESTPKYGEDCPDCGGQGNLTTVKISETLLS